MKKFATWLIITLLLTATFPKISFAAAGMSVSGGGSKTVGSNFTLTVRASGAEFDSLQGTISVSGPVTVVSVSGGAATWLPGKSPSNGGQFVGIVSPTSSLTVATITLRGTKEGSGSVSVSGVSLARNGSYVGTSGGSASFTITRAPVVPGSVTVTSDTHPDQASAYEATTVILNWTKANGVTGFSYLFDEVADTTPATKVTSADTTITYANTPIGVHYFHIRALNGDGWGPVTHFKVTIKEPDAKENTDLSIPEITSIVTTENSTVDLDNGTLTGIKITGKVLAGYGVNLIVKPADRLPKDLGLSALPSSLAATATATAVITASPTATEVADVGQTTEKSTTQTATMTDDGDWTIIWDKPIPAGFYTIAAQGQQAKVLTPSSETKKVEISLAKGGSVKILTNDDLNKPILSQPIKVMGIQFSSRAKALTATILFVLGLLVIALGVVLYVRNRKKFHIPNPFDRIG